ncbi:hypothetical protein JCM6882_007996 [Rhodosporidiobolus microsporus]
MSSSSASSAFERAVAWVGSSQVSTSNETKLRLYALYKIATASHTPSTSRPGIFDFTGRAKWDAWAAAGKGFEGEGEDGGKARARREYEDEARRLGWVDAETGEAGEVEQPIEAVKQPAQEKQERMVAVSVLESDFVDEAPKSRLHELALDGDAASLDGYLQGEGKKVDLNERDSYGYAALHLAVDRGNLAAAKVLLAAGADKALQDEDGNTPLDLARLAEQDDLVALLSS